MSVSTQSPTYTMTPIDHIKLAEQYAQWADSESPRDSIPYRQVNAILALAHAQIAQVQLMHSSASLGK